MGGAGGGETQRKEGHTHSVIIYLDLRKLTERCENIFLQLNEEK